jgi:hypothetical protein
MDRHAFLFGIYESRNNRHGEGHTSLIGVNDVTFTSTLKPFGILKIRSVMRKRMLPQVLHYLLTWYLPNTVCFLVILLLVGQLCTNDANFSITVTDLVHGTVLESLVVIQLVKNFAELCTTWKFITSYAGASHSSLC